MVDFYNDCILASSKIPPIKSKTSANLKSGNATEQLSSKRKTSAIPVILYIFI